MRLLLLSVSLLFCTVSLLAQKNASVSFEKWLSLKNVGSPLISPDGKTVIYSVNSTDWANNSYDSELWMWKEGIEPLQLTRTSKASSSNARFTPDSRYVSFIANRGDKNQLFIISVNGGEAIQVTRDEDGVGNYEWSPDGSKIIYTKADPESKKDKTIRERFGAFGVEGEEYKQNHLYLLNFSYDSIFLAGQLPCYGNKKDSTKSDKVIAEQPCYNLPLAKQLTKGEFNVASFKWSPDGRKLGLSVQKDPIITSSVTSAIVIMDLGSKKMDTVVNYYTGDFFAGWSPDGKSFLYSTNLNDTGSYFYLNDHLFIYDLATKKSREIAQDIDEERSVIDWNKEGIFLGALDKTRSKVYRVDPATGKSTIVTLPLDLGNSLSFSKNTDLVAVAGRTYDGLNEIYVTRLGQPLNKITNSSAQIKNWNTPVNEVINWQSKDGATIEGVLLKPRNYDPKKKYPLLVVIHGGPTGVDLPDPVPAYVYPIMQWTEKGALVLRVNYRGSAGYGEKFRSLNVRNLGVGDMWDVMSGIDYLNKKGMIDTTRMGAMGWSQGGYISAFLTTNTNVFKAISVGAGISDWVTYYVNTDITPFTRQYLKATPWSDMAIYQKTSPMTNINNASTPTLIQHGEFDKRVPIPNAYQLYRGLQDRGIPSKLIVYKGFGHGITKPKERLAAVWHNWQWFNKYVFGEPEESMPLD
jgi:dipeptidyl aminopeptidase/acylaminoacyl peptidase